MSFAFSKNLLKQVARSRSQGNRYYQNNGDTPEILKDKTTRQVSNDSLELLFPIIQQTALSMFVDTPIGSEPTALHKDDVRVPRWLAKTQSTWVVTYSNLCDEEDTLELFDADQLRLCTVTSDPENKLSWSQLLNALPKQLNSIETD